MIDTFAILAYLLTNPYGPDHGPEAFKLNSPAFKNHHSIPLQYTCFGRKMPIPLHWSGVPSRAKSLAIIMTDQDMPRQVKYYHWAIFNISPRAHKLTNHKETTANSWWHKTYQPPCPKKDLHHYQIRIYALDIELPHKANHDPITLRHAMRHHIIDVATLTGQVSKPKT